MLKKTRRRGAMGRGGKSVSYLEPLVSLPANKSFIVRGGDVIQLSESSKTASGVHFLKAVFPHELHP